MIAIKSENKILTVNSLYSSNEGIPNYLRVDIKYGEIKLSVIGIRICMVESKKKFEEMEYALEYIKDIENPAVIIGDFNNYRRKTIDKEWNLNLLEELLIKNKFTMHTPDGSSVYVVKACSAAYEFAEDHIFAKNIEVEIKPYYREFVIRNKKIYKWEKDFQKYIGKDEKGNSIYDSIPVPYPDHAILIADIYFDDDSSSLTS